MLSSNITRFLVMALAAAFVIYPQFADARAGSGRSMGSRGSNTYQSTPSQGVQPINRSTTAQPGAAPRQAQPAASLPYNSGGHPFLSGLAGGFLGAGLASMLFGHSFGDVGGGAGAGGMGLLPILLILGVIYFIYKRFKNSKMSFSGNQYSGVALPSGGVSQQVITVTDTDKTAFEQSLYKIQQKWSEGDLNGLRQYVTPEMLQYFSEELSANASRGVANKIEKVQLQHADIVEAWHEYDMDYVTARLQWSALDYNVRLDRQSHDSDYIASGTTNATEIAEEVWTFARSSGGNWLLSAIQQVE